MEKISMSRVTFLPSAFWGRICAQKFNHLVLGPDLPSMTEKIKHFINTVKNKIQGKH